MSERYDLVVRGGTVYDGSGAPGARADVGVRGDRITAVGAIVERGGSEVDATGLAVTPGFIDVHSHDDFAVLLNPAMDFKVLQGVTSDVVGNCGSGVVPFDAALRRFGRFHPGASPPEWDGFGGYLDRVSEAGPACNVAVLIGHGSLRAGAMGGAQRPPSGDEMRRMRGWVEEGMAAGAVGLSTGLIYEPGRYAHTEEVIDLVRAQQGRGLYATHMRNEADALLESVREAMRIGEEGGVPVQISHHKASGRDNWGRVADSLALIEAARARGLDVTADQYPYTAGSTSLAAVVQNGAFRRDSPGGIGRLAADGVLIASAPGHPAYEGQTLAALGARWGTDVEATAARVIAEEGEACFVVVFSMDEADVRRVLVHPTTMIGSDGVPAAGSRPHPRLYGCFPRILGHYARDLGLLDLPTAIHKMTGMPAAKFGLADRGLVRPGAFADLVVFDPARIRDVATYDDPCRPPEGIRGVFVNGVAVARDGALTGSRGGRALRWAAT
jgi:N-acyl-D-amino-acid deacylase